VYEVPPDGFTERMRGGKPSGEWHILEQNMPRVRDETGSKVPGIPLDEPARRVTIHDLIEQDGLRVCSFTDTIAIAMYLDAAHDASRLGVEDEFVSEAVERGWLEDVTAQFLDPSLKPQ
jgi:hypothetical protein